MSERKLVISHANCPDGFTAAWAVWLVYPDAEFFPGVYGQAPPDVTGRDVIMVDFSYKHDVMLKMMNDAHRIVVLDHHKSAEAELAGLDTMHDAKANVYIYFDMNKSGAMLAWEYFHEGVEPPSLVKYVEDRDLWRFALPNSNDINSAILSYPYDFNTWSKTATRLAYSEGRNKFAMMGEAINRKQTRDIAEIVDMTKRRAVIGGYEVWCANMPYTMAPQATHIMGKDEPFAATYYRRKDGKYVYSLRSSEEGIDVSEIASRYGGGGHKHAAGFETFGELR
jgi:oligoribonuclease NrnB/cAMP/cGMP phosphodiesterase (DHH superfamily)